LQSVEFTESASSGYLLSILQDNFENFVSSSSVSIISTSKPFVMFSRTSDLLFEQGPHELF